MNSHHEERPPIFGFLWPVPAKSSETPVVHQTKFVRIGTRGALRISLLIALAVSIAIFSGGVILVGFTSGFSGWTFLSSALLASLCVILARGSVSGTYVNDEGIAIRNLWSSRFFPWEQSLVIPVGNVITVHNSRGTFRTHVGRWSIDWPTGGERYDIAFHSIRTWALSHHAWGPSSP